MPGRPGPAGGGRGSASAAWLRNGQSPADVCVCLRHHHTAGLGFQRSSPVRCPVERGMSGQSPACVSPSAARHHGATPPPPCPPTRNTVCFQHPACPSAARHERAAAAVPPAHTTYCLARAYPHAPLDAPPRGRRALWARALSAMSLSHVPLDASLTSLSMPLSRLSMPSRPSRGISERLGASPRGPGHLREASRGMGGT